MTNQELKLRCYELVGELPLITGNRMDDAKHLYEWVSSEDMSSIKDSFEDLEKAIEGWSEEAKEKGFTFKEVEVELSPDQKTVVESLRELSQHRNLEEYLEDWAKELVEASLPKEKTSTFEPTISTDDCRIKISHKGSERIIEVESEGDEITLGVSGTNSAGGNNFFTFCRPGVEAISSRDISLDDRQATIKDTEENITYKLTFI